MKEFIQFVAILTALLISPATGADVVVYGQVGETVTLPVSYQGTDVASLYVYWYFGETQVLTRNNYDIVSTGGGDQWKGRLSLDKTYSLIIKNIKAEEFSAFSCEIKKVQLVLSKTTYKLLTVSVRPTAAPLLAGETLSLSCDAQRSGGHVQPQIHWLNPKGERIAGVGAGRSLTVAKVTGQHHGLWTCVVVTPDGREAIAKTSVTVIDLSPAPSPLYTSVSSSLNIPCSIPPRVSWGDLKAKGFQRGHWSFRNSTASWPLLGSPQTLFSLAPDDTAWTVVKDVGMTMSDFKRDNRTLSLRRERAREADRGEYTCVLEFRGGITLSTTVHVEVLQVHSSPGRELLIGQQINLTCSLGHTLPPDLEIKWIPPRSPVPANHPAHLTIPQAGDGDRGRWRCNLWRNKAIVVSAEVTLKIERAPVDTWLLVTICGAAVIFVLLLILTVILIRRHRQRKTTPRRHKRRFCRCTHPKPKGFYRT